MKIIKKTLLFLIISIMYQNVLSQTKTDTIEQKIIPYLFVVNDRIILPNKYYLDFDTTRVQLTHLYRKNLITVYASGFCIEMSKNDFETLTLINPEVTIYFEYYAPNIVYPQIFKLNGKFKNVVDKEFNIVEIRTSSTKKIKFHYISSTYEKRFRWEKKYSITNF